MGYNVKSVREGFKKNGIFYTPRPLAEYMRSFLPTDIAEVYDPSCGHGSLFVPPMEYQAEVVEILERMRTEIRKTEDTAAAVSFLIAEEADVWTI